jgi:hypothetical protein
VIGMNIPAKDGRYSGVRIAQFISIFVMWIFVVSISAWIVNLLALSIELQDALEASIGIGLVAIPVYLTLAVILTYVFFGLRKEEQQVMHSVSDEEQ